MRLSKVHNAFTPRLSPPLYGGIKGRDRGHGSKRLNRSRTSRSLESAESLQRLPPLLLKKIFTERLVGG